MIETFFGMAMITFVVAVVCGVPLWLVSLWRRKGRVAAWFAGLAGAAAVVFGFFAVATEVSIDACEADGGIACADGYFGFFSLWFLVLAAFLVAALVAAFVVAWRGGDADDKVPEHLWCENCSDLVVVEGHRDDHSLRPMALPPHGDGG